MIVLWYLKRYAFSLMCSIGLFAFWVPLSFAQQENIALSAVINLANEGQYDKAAQAAPGDQILIDWIKLRKGDGAFSDYRSFAKNAPNWPMQRRFSQLAEQTLSPPYLMSERDLVDWFSSRSPQTGQGALALSWAYEALSQKDKARETMVHAWLDLPFSKVARERALKQYSLVLSPYHEERLNRILWKERRSDAEALLNSIEAELSTQQRQQTRQRLSYLGNKKELPYPESQMKTAMNQRAGLAYAYVNWLMSQGRAEDAMDVILAYSVSAARLEQPFRWSGWRRLLARRAMRDGNAQTAYRLASQHFLTTGYSYADLEWLSGYIALRYLHDPQKALIHFERVSQSSAHPRVVGRASYWLGRSYQELGDVEAAQFSYQIAAAHQSSFYGLLAAHTLGEPLPQKLLTITDLRATSVKALMQKTLVRAAFALMHAGHENWAGAFFSQLGRELTQNEISKLAGLLIQKKQAYLALVLGKSAATKGVLVPNAYYPIHPLVEHDFPVSHAMTLAVARQESAFQTSAGSRVGAQGLMQLMPATAQEVSESLGLPYRYDGLATDWLYNARLGTQYLASLQNKFGPSPVLIATGYNAGPGRTDIWIDDFGDPRLGAVDMVDWIEHIPFRETRNYVFKVLEALPVYHARLFPDHAPLDFQEILQGKKPILRPVFRPKDVK